MTGIAHDVTAPAPPRLQEVADDIFAYLQPDGTWWINNTGFLVGSRGVISVDACSTERRTRVTVLEEVIAPLGAETIVPGHGPVAGPELIERVLGYLRFVQETAVRGKEAGPSPLEAARETGLGPYAELTDPERLVGNLHRGYAELDGTEPGGQIDLFAALSDMIAFNGGKPLTCRA